MSKEKVVAKEPENPFGGFNVLKGGIVPPTEDKVEDDVLDEDSTIVEEKLEDLDEEAEQIAKADKLLEEVAKKQAAALDKKKKASEPTTEEDELDSEETDGKEDKTKENGYKSAISALFDKGILEVDLEKIEDSEEGFDNAIEETLKNRTSKWVQSKNPDYIKFMEFTDNGGDPKQFLDIYYGNHTWEGFKVESEEAQKLAVRESLRLNDESPEDIEEIVTEWSDNGTLEKRAKSALVKLQKNETYQKEELVSIQKEYADKQKAAQQEYWEGFKKDLYSKEDIKGFKLTPKQKDNLWSYMTVIDKKTGKTEYQKATEAEKDSSLLFAYFAMNKFDTAKLEKQVETKVSRKYNSILNNYTTSTKEKISTGLNETYADNNPFKGFKSA